MVARPYRAARALNLHRSLAGNESEEWARQFHEWAESHDRTTPLLTDEAISRESLYLDRI